MGLGSKVVTKATASTLPPLAAGYVRTVLEKSIDGIGPLPPVRVTAAEKLASCGGNVDRAVAALVRSHTAMAGLQGLLTNLGGITYAAATVPANIVGVTVVQCHLVASIAHLRGYDVHDPRVRNAILATMLGEDTVTTMIKSGRLPSSPMAIATSPVYDPSLDNAVAKEVTSELVGRTIGRRALVMVGRSIPLFGGAVGASADSYFTWLVGRYAQRELRPRAIPSRQI
jgi:uncharacterized protein (DUF697 family)